jgi:hypothetical protein
MKTISDYGIPGGVNQEKQRVKNGISLCLGKYFIMRNMFCFMKIRIHSIFTATELPTGWPDLYQYTQEVHHEHCSTRNFEQHDASFCPGDQILCRGKGGILQA